MARGIKNDRPQFDSSLGIFDEDSIKDKYKELARETRRLLKVGTAAELTVRDGAYKAGVQPHTVYKLMRGTRVDYGSLLNFALAMGADVNKMLQLCGYNPLQFTASEIEKAENFLPPGYKIVLSEGDEASSLDTEMKEMIDDYVSGFPPGMQDEVRGRLYNAAFDLMEKTIAWEKAKGTPTQDARGPAQARVVLSRPYKKRMIA